MSGYKEYFLSDEFHLKPGDSIRIFEDGSFQFILNEAVLSPDFKIGLGCAEIGDVVARVTIPPGVVVSYETAWEALDNLYAKTYGRRRKENEQQTSGLQSSSGQDREGGLREESSRSDPSSIQPWRISEG